jgi:hypothetical protein
MTHVKEFLKVNWLGTIGGAFLLAAPIFFAVGAAERGRNAVLAAGGLLVIYWLDKSGAKGLFRRWTR